MAWSGIMIRLYSNKQALSFDSTLIVLISHLRLNHSSRLSPPEAFSSTVPKGQEAYLSGSYAGEQHVFQTEAIA